MVLKLKKTRSYKAIGNVLFYGSTIKV